MNQIEKICPAIQIHWLVATQMRRLDQLLPSVDADALLLVPAAE